MSPILKIFIALFVIFSIQSVFSIFQIRAYQKALQKCAKELGNIGVGQKKAKFGIIKGNIIIIGSDADGTIRGGQIMEGVTLMARFKPIQSIIDGRPISPGETIYDYLAEFRAMDKKQQKYYKGQIMALEALEMRFLHQAEDARAKELLEKETDVDVAEEFDIDDL